MNRPIRLSALALALLCAAALSGCGSTQQTSVITGAESTIGAGAALGHDMAQSLTAVHSEAAGDTGAATEAVTSLTEMTQEPDVREAIYGLSWEIGCGITTRIRPDEAAVRDQVLRRALDLGVVFADRPTVDLVVDTLIDAFDVDMHSDLEATCVGLDL